MPGPAAPEFSLHGPAAAEAAAAEPATLRTSAHPADAPETRQLPPRRARSDEGTTRTRGASGGRAATAGRRAGGGRPGKRHNLMMAGMLLAPVLVVVLVVAGYVYLRAKPAPANPHAAAPRHPAAAPAATTKALGPWKHIESRSLDSAPLSVTELFPQQFSSGGAAGTQTVEKASTNCSREVFGSKLAKEVKKAGCTQVLRASYLSSDHKIMATVGVLNLTDVTAAEHVGKVAGSSEFIKQLPAAHGPTRNLTKGTGIEEAEVKGHYLILIWTEYSNLHAPSGKKQRTKLEAFSAGLIAGTANLSLSQRMVTGHPSAPPTPAPTATP